MKAWKKGAVIGAVWGAFPSGLAIFEDILGYRIWPFFEGGIMWPIGFLLILPTRMAITLGFQFNFVLIAAPLVGILFGILISITYAKVKKSKSGDS